MHHSGTKLVVLGGADPLAGEGAEGGEGGGTSPDRVLSGGIGDHSDIVSGWECGGHLVLESLGETLEHGGTSGEDDVLGEVLSHVKIGLIDGFVGDLLHRVVGSSVKGWLEEELWSLDSDLSLNDEDFLIWESVVLVKRTGVLAGSLGLLESLLGLTNIAGLLLDLSNDFHLGGGVHVSSHALKNEVLHVLGKNTSGNINSLNGVWDGVSLIDWDGMRNTIS